MNRDELLRAYKAGETNFAGALFHGIDLTFIDVRGANFYDAHFDDCNLSNSIFARCNFQNASFVKTPIVNCNLIGTDFTNAFITKDNLHTCNIKNAIFNPDLFKEIEKINILHRRNPKNKDEVRAFCLVRDKQGMPKVDEPLSVPSHVWDSFSEIEKKHINAQVAEHFRRFD